MSGSKSSSWRLVPAGSGGGTYSFGDMQQILRRHFQKIEALQRPLAELKKVSSLVVLNSSLERLATLEQT